MELIAEVIVSVALIGLGLMATYMGIRNLRTFHGAQWKTTEGKVSISEAREHTDYNTGMTLHVPYVSYTYTVNSKDYNSHWITIGSTLTPQFKKVAAEDILRDWPVGKKVRVFYVPDGKGYAACLDPKNPTWMSYITVGVGIVTMIAGIALIIFPIS